MGGSDAAEPLEAPLPAPTQLPVASVQLAAQPTSSRLARRFVAQHLQAWGLAELRDDAELLVSELVTNAVLHARAPVDLVIRRVRGTIRVEVFDAGDGLPLPVFPALDDTSGRGLGLVQAVAERWGVEETAEGKVVWFELDP